MDFTAQTLTLATRSSVLTFDTWKRGMQELTKCS